MPPMIIKTEPIQTVHRLPQLFDIQAAGKGKTTPGMKIVAVITSGQTDARLHASTYAQESCQMGSQSKIPNWESPVDQ